MLWLLGRNAKLIVSTHQKTSLTPLLSPKNLCLLAADGPDGVCMGAIGAKNEGYPNKGQQTITLCECCSVMRVSLLHFNDVYRVTKQRLPSGMIDVTQFCELVNSIRSSWNQTQGGMLLFSGDVFSPSVESSVTRGSHMVPVMNMIRPDVALTGERYRYI